MKYLPILNNKKRDSKILILVIVDKITKIVYYKSVQININTK